MRDLLKKLTRTEKAVLGVTSTVGALNAAFDFSQAAIVQKLLGATNLVEILAIVVLIVFLPRLKK
jgi:hypothetical protein